MPRAARMLPLLFTILALVPALHPASAWAQAESDAAADLRLTPEAVSQLRTSAQADTGLDEATRARIDELYNEADGLLNAVAEREASAANYERARTNAPADLAAIDAELAKPLADPAAGLTDEMPLAELESLLQAGEAALTSAQQTFSDLQEEPAQRARRRASIPDLLVSARKSLQEVQAQIAENPAGTDAPRLAQAKRIVLVARSLLHSAEIRGLETELQSFDARSGLLSKRQDLARRRLNEAEQRVKVLRERAAAAREAEARLAAEEARRGLEDVLQAAPEIRDRVEKVALANAARAEQRTSPDGLPQKIAEVSAALDRVNADLQRITAEETALRERVSAGGLSGAIGQILLRHRADVPNVRQLQRSNRERGQRLADAEIAAIDERELRREVGDVDALVSEALNDLEPTYTDFERNRIAATIRAQYETQRNLVEATLRDLERYAALLNELGARERELAEQSAGFAEFIDENLLWSRGDTLRGWVDLQDAAAGLKWVGNPAAWRSILVVGTADVLTNFTLYGIASILILLSFITLPRLLRTLNELGDRAHRQWHTTFQQTVEATVVTFLLTLPLPILFAFAAWRLGVANDGGELARGVSAGLNAVGVLSFGLGASWMLMRPKGLFEAHFEWDNSVLPAARRQIAAAGALLAPLLFATHLFITQATDERWSATLGRATFVVGMLVLSAAGGRLLHTYLRAAKKREGAAWLTQNTRIHLLSRAFVVGFPIALAIAATLGYYYAARLLAERYAMTLLVGLLGLVLLGLVQRWLMLAQRRLKLEQVRRERAAARAEAERAAGEGGEQEPAAAPPEVPDLVKLDAQTKRLVRVGVVLGIFSMLYFVWADTLPALNVLERIELWQTTVQVEEVVTLEGGATETRVETRIKPVTASHIFTGLLIFFLAVVAVRNLPGLIEIILLQRLQVGAGERYAILTITRYVLSMVGIVLGFSAIGISWSSLQWLVAALGVGLGFGLQEIFANFISGIILLFERPIRVGDVVTIGDVSGSVSRIQMRATTITDWDRKELVVPNKEFVTGRLINWTLTDRTLRIIIPIRIAYGSDTQKAIQIFTDIVQAHPNTLEDPAPQILFTGFGASSLDFEIRAFSVIDNALTLKHELLLQIDQACRASGVEIAFPQRDLHIRSGLEHLLPNPSLAAKEGPNESA